jgi:hypothetical protein
MRCVYVWMRTIATVYMKDTEDTSLKLHSRAILRVDMKLTKVLLP